MTDREKVIKAIKSCMDHNHLTHCNECYLDGPGFGIVCRKELMQDALVLLREQEPVEPKWRKGYAYCSQCGYKLHWIADRNNFCPNCGRAVKWDADGA